MEVWWDRRGNGGGREEVCAGGGVVGVAALHSNEIKWKLKCWLIAFRPLITCSVTHALWGGLPEEGWGGGGCSGRRAALVYRSPSGGNNNAVCQPDSPGTHLHFALKNPTHTSPPFPFFWLTAFAANETSKGVRDSGLALYSLVWKARLSCCVCVCE